MTLKKRPCASADLPRQLKGLKRFTKTEPFNTTAARQAIAQKLIEENEYCW